MAQGITVMLSEDQTSALSREIYDIVTNSIEAARRDTGLDREYLRRKYAAKFAGVSPNTFDSWHIPGHVISDGITLFAKKDISSFIAAH